MFPLHEALNASSKWNVGIETGDALNVYSQDFLGEPHNFENRLPCGEAHCAQEKF